MCLGGGSSSFVCLLTKGSQPQLPWWLMEETLLTGALYPLGLNLSLSPWLQQQQQQQEEAGLESLALLLMSCLGHHGASAL